MHFQISHADSEVTKVSMWLPNPDSCILLQAAEGLISCSLGESKTLREASTIDPLESFLPDYTYTNIGICRPKLNKNSLPKDFAASLMISSYLFLIFYSNFMVNVPTAVSPSITPQVITTQMEQNIFCKAMRLIPGCLVIIVNHL